MTADTREVDLTPPSKSRTWPAPWVSVTAAMGIVLLSLIVFAGYLWSVSEAWEQRVNELTAVSYDLGDQLTKERQTIAARDDTINLLSEQLQTVQQRLLDLAAQVARSDDDAIVTEQRIATLEELIRSAGSVANALTRCVDSQDQLAEYLRESEFYEPEELEAYEQSVERLCESAKSANEQLQEAINQP